MEVGKNCGETDLKYEVQFHEAIASVIPLLIKLLENDDGFIRRKVVELVGKLANHGE